MNFDVCPEEALVAYRSLRDTPPSDRWDVLGKLNWKKSEKLTSGHTLLTFGDSSQLWYCVRAFSNSDGDYMKVQFGVA